MIIQRDLKMKMNILYI